MHKYDTYVYIKYMYVYRCVCVCVSRRPVRCAYRYWTHMCVCTHALRCMYVNVCACRYRVATCMCVNPSRLLRQSPTINMCIFMYICIYMHPHMYLLYTHMTMPVSNIDQES